MTCLIVAGARARLLRRSWTSEVGRATPRDLGEVVRHSMAIPARRLGDESGDPARLAFGAAAALVKFPGQDSGEVFFLDRSGVHANADSEGPD